VEKQEGLSERFKQGAGENINIVDFILSSVFMDYALFKKVLHLVFAFTTLFITM
jgi:hypothetical protein